MALVSLSQHLFHPWSFKTLKGEKVELARIEKIKSIAMLIIGLPLAIVGGPLLFYTYTNICKKRAIVKLEPFCHIGTWFNKIAAQIIGKKIEKAAKFLPKNAKSLGTLYPLSKKIKSLLHHCKLAKNETSLRSLLLELGGALMRLNRLNKNLYDEHYNFVHKEGQTPEALKMMEHVQEEIEVYKEIESKAYADLACMVDSLSINPYDLENEIKLLDGIPTKHQYHRFRKILETQFVIHDVRGDGACAPRSLSNGIWPKLLEYRLINHDATHPDEPALAEQLRNEVVDYMIENVENYKNNRNLKGNIPHNDDGTEARDYRMFVLESNISLSELDTYFENYTERMRNPSTWFGDPEMKAAAQKYGARDGVHIITYSPNAIEIKNNRIFPRDELGFGDRKGRKIYLFHSGGHYEIMSPRAGFTERLAPKAAPGRQR